MDVENAVLAEYKYIVLPFLFILILVEIIWNWIKKKNVYNLKEVGGNFAILIGSQLSKAILLGYQIAILSFFYQYRLFNIQNSVFTFIVLFLFIDFLYYWQHRILHEVKIFWTFHLVHHSSPWMNLTTSFRLNWLSPLITPFFYLPVSLLGFDSKLVAPILAINLLYQFWLHTEMIGSLGFLERIFNTPSNHRVHHGSNRIYLDKNYGGFLIFWDILFGTYQPETEKPNYGITTGFVSHNPVKLVFHGFVDYFSKNPNKMGRG